MAMTLDALDTADLGVAVTRVALGIDALERAVHPDAGGLVPIFMGAGRVTARPYADWSDADADLADLERAARALPAGPRGVFLLDFLRSLRAAARLFRGEAMGYADKVRELVGAPEGPADPEVVAILVDRLDAALARAGHGRGDLASRVDAWEAAEAIEPAKLEAVFRDLMAIAKARTDAMIFDTGDYDMTLNPLRNVPFTARCGFDARRMDLNVDQSFSRAALKHLVCHEVFPGHATQLLYTHAEVEAGRSQADALLCAADAVTGCVQEGIGDQGAQLIDWIDDLDDEIHLALRSVKSAVQTTAAWRLMAEGRPAAEVADYLRTAAFGQEAWVTGRLRMAAHPFRGPFIASYWAGNESVRRVRERVGADRREAFLTYLYGQVHSPQSLEMFDDPQLEAAA
jgi:hypothetical protein